MPHWAGDHDATGHRVADDTEPHYVDTLALSPGTTALWKYRALYLDGDQPFGQWSDTVQIAVQG